jgi:hypothetical protein
MPSAHGKGGRVARLRGRPRRLPSSAIPPRRKDLGHQNSHAFWGRKDRQVGSSNLYSNIDTMETTIDGKKVVDTKAMGGCNTKITSSGYKFIYIDCSVSNSKNVLSKFRISNTTDVQRMLTQ